MIPSLGHRIAKSLTSCCGISESADPISAMKRKAATRLERDEAKYLNKQRLCNQTTQKGWAQWKAYEDLIKAERVRYDMIQRIDATSTPEQKEEAFRLHRTSLNRLKAELLARHALQINAQRDEFLRGIPGMQIRPNRARPMAHPPAPVPRLIPNDSEEQSSIRLEVYPVP